jgi:hypothetical protein
MHLEKKTNNVGPGVRLTLTSMARSSVNKLREPTVNK